MMHVRRTINIWWVIAVFACVLAAFSWYNGKLTATIEELSGVVEENTVRLSQLQAENAKLEATLKSAGTDAFIENQARTEYGYMMPDEIRFVITGAETALPQTTQSPEQIPSP